MYIEKLLNQSLSLTATPMFVADRGMNVIWANQAYLNLVCCSEQATIGKPPASFECAIANQTTYREITQQINSGNAWIGEMRHATNNGRVLHTLTVITPVKEVDTLYFFVQHQDITSQQSALSKVWHAAHYDSLTSLPNRVLFNNLLEHSVQRARRALTQCAILFIDLDGFKPINDTYGHGMGDKFLSHIGKVLKETIRRSDAACRFGGDEFGVLLTEFNSVSDSALVATKILAAINEPVVIDNIFIKCGASIGIAVFPDNEQTSEKLLKAADSAMYQAKAAGKNTIFSAMTGEYYNLPLEAQNITNQGHGEPVWLYA